MTLPGNFTIDTHTHTRVCIRIYIYSICMCRAELSLFFFRVIQNIIELKPKSKYTVAVDDSKNTLEEIIKVTLNVY